VKTELEQPVVGDAGVVAHREGEGIGVRHRALLGDPAAAGHVDPEVGIGDIAPRQHGEEREQDPCRDTALPDPHGRSRLASGTLVKKFSFPGREN
jgi:hypothetical protein